MGDKIERECPECGVTYAADVVRLSHGRQTTCSRACSYALRGREREKWQAFVCPVCGDEFRRIPAHMVSKHGHQFCSRSCHYRGRGLGLSKRVVTEPYTYSDGGLRELSRTGAERYARTPCMWPKTEGAACEALEARGEAVDRQRVWELSYGFICTDLYLPAHRLVVELDGECHDSTRDSDRDSELSAMGVTVLRIPDTGVPEEAADAVVGAFLRATA